MDQSLSMDGVFKKLSTVGLSASYVRKAGLPSWWSDELNNVPAAVLEGAAHIAQRLRIEFKSLLEEDSNIRFKPLPQTKFKYQQQQSSNVSEIAWQLASRIAELVASSVPQAFVPLPQKTDDIRGEILQSHSVINLESLVDYCWRHGVAVAYFNEYPPNTRKVTGLVQWHENCPTILLSHQRTHPAWLAFHLAHELGHLALGHVKAGILIDDDISSASDDAEEMAANQFAVRLLVNGLDNCLGKAQIYNSHQLKQKILEKVALEPTVDGCILALNYSWHTKKYGLANQAIKHLAAAENGDQIINRCLERHVDWEKLGDDNTDQLEHILGDDI